MKPRGGAFTLLLNHYPALVPRRRGRGGSRSEEEGEKEEVARGLVAPKKGSSSGGEEDKEERTFARWCFLANSIAMLVTPNGTASCFVSSLLPSFLPSILPSFHPFPPSPLPLVINHLSLSPLVRFRVSSLSSPALSHAQPPCSYYPALKEASDANRQTSLFILPPSSHPI